MDLIKAMLVELPSQRRLRFRSYGLNDQQIEVFTISRHLGDYYEHVATELNSSAQDYHHRKGLKGVFPSEPGISGKLHSLSANYIITEFPPLLGLRDLGLDDIVGLKISPESFSELMVLVFHKEISST